MQPFLPAPPVRRPILKLMALAALVVLMLVPVAQLLGLVRERASRQDAVRAELASLWGGEQTVGALVLAVPYRAKDAPPPAVVPAAAGAPAAAPQTAPGAAPPGGWAKGVAPASAIQEPPGWFFALPADLSWRGAMKPERRRRGLFEVTLYEAELSATGWFRRPDVAALGLTPDRVDWDGARAILLVGDTRGLQRRVALQWVGQEKVFQPGGGPFSAWPAAIHAPLGASALADERWPFQVDLVLRGSEALRLLPLGESTRVELTSSWPDPGFIGAPLPSERRVAGQGFTALWDVPYFARTFPQQWRRPHLAGIRVDGVQIDPAAFGAQALGAQMAANQVDEEQLGRQLTEASFGVSLVRPADPYQQTERAVKYAVLFILLTFTTVFLLELMSPVRLHPVHYLLVGSSLCLFYLLLLALAEHVGIGVAYGIATAATVGTVGLYARSVLAGRGRAAVVSGALVALYGWLFTVLRAEDYALLLGALGLFATLAAVMFLTRRLDWATLRFREPAAGQVTS
jgi:inner membrane protein